MNKIQMNKIQMSKRMMNRIKKAAAAVLSLVLFMGMFFSETRAEAVAWDIENSLNVSGCEQGDTLLLSVYLKGGGGMPQEITGLHGTLEYDNSLFIVDQSDILPADSGKAQSTAFDQDAGTFDVNYSGAVTVENGGLMLQMRLNTAADASIGKTTVCVTHMEWDISGSTQKVQIEHRVPAAVTISKAELSDMIGDVSGDEEVDLTDVKLVMQHYNGYRKLDSRQKARADVNGDGKVNLTDAKLIMQYYNGEISDF